jgi:hypothetical protein
MQDAFILTLLAMQEVQCPATSVSLRVSTLSYTQPEGFIMLRYECIRKKNQIRQQLATETVSRHRETCTFTQWKTGTPWFNIRTRYSRSIAVLIKARNIYTLMLSSQFNHLFLYFFFTTRFGHNWPSSGVLFCQNCYAVLNIKYSFLKNFKVSYFSVSITKLRCDSHRIDKITCWLKT